MSQTSGIAMRRVRRRLAAACAAVALLLVLAATGSAGAATVWRIASVHGPQNLPPGSTTGQYVIELFNIGTTDSNGTVTVSDVLPAGVTATAGSGDGWTCAVPATTVTCTRIVSVAAPGTSANGRGAAPTITLTVNVPPAAAGTANNLVRVSGGGGALTTAVDPTTFSATRAGFGIVPGSYQPDLFDVPFPATSPPSRQAGAHPFELRVGFDMNLTERSDPQLGAWTEPDEYIKTTQVHLPAGLIGNPEAVPQCPSLLLLAQGVGDRGDCPTNTQVGVADLILQSGSTFNPGGNLTTPIYNMVPPKGAVAAFAMSILANPVWIVATLDPRDYSVVTTIHDTNDVFQVRSANLRFWGVPADPAHDPERIDSTATDVTLAFGAHFTGAPIRPFLTMPSQCGVDGSIGIQLDSWQHPGAFVSAQGSPFQMSGCGDPRFRFAPSIAVAPDASTPSGLSVDLSVPQKDDTVANATDLYAASGKDAAIATPPLRDAVVTLPAGMAISPSAANGLASCSSAQIELGTNDDPTCPDASKIGTATLTTPLLGSPVPGTIYLAAQTDNPFGSLLAIYLVLHDADRGLTIKLPGKISPDPLTGQLVTTFADNPQLPFSDLHLHFEGGPRAPLVTPPACGSYTATASLSSWNASLPAASAASTFAIASGCAPRGFDPSFTAGGTSTAAGRDTSLITRFSRTDADQQLGAIDVKLPRGVMGRIVRVPLCADAAASAGTCGESSRIGGAVVAAGPGPFPIYVTDGRVYVTGPYKGAPFGLSIVVHAKAGPLDLGNVVVRAQIQVDRATTQLRIVTDPLPTIVQGIPLQLRLAQVTVDRPGFMFNPTNCSTLYSTAQLSSTQGAHATRYSRFRVGRCGSLHFAPSLTLTVGSRGHTARGSSTPLTATVRMGRGQANLRTVRVLLPATLNARLEVLQHACTLAQFEAAHCSSRAKAGSAVAVTPVLAQPLRGPVYFVRNPARVLPDLMVALRGQVAVDLTGKVTVTQSGRLETAFDTIPDVPISSFVLRIVSGRNGPLGALANLCTARSRGARAVLGFRAQNGKLVQRAETLRVNGCPTAKQRARGR